MKSIRIKGLVIFGLMCLIFKFSSAQQVQEVQPASTYPRVVGFFAVLVPVGTVNDKGFKSNFSDRSAFGLPFGFNLLKSDHIGYSMELVPFIQGQNGSSKLNYVLFHPGVMFRFSHGFTFTPRLAFQTDGRYGVTPVFSKVILSRKDYQFYLSLSEPMRYGNYLPSSYTTALQFGISF